jgi:hypothetical protein
LYHSWKPIGPLWTKLVAKYTEGIYPVCLGRRGRMRNRNRLYRVKQLSSHCRESQVHHCLGETSSKLKLRVSLKEKVNSNLQASL